MIGDKHCVRCATQAMGKPERFYGNSFCFLRTHGRSPFARAKRDLEPKQEHGEPAGVQCGNTEGLETPRPSALTESRWTARLPTARLPFCGGKKARGGSTDCRVSFERGQIKPAPSAFTLASQIFMHHEKDYTCPPTLESPQLYSALRPVFHGECAIISTVQHQHGQTAANALKLERTLDYTTFLFCAIIN